MCSPSAPDNSGQNAAALQQAQLSAEQLAWAKQIYAETAGDRADATATAKATSQAQLEAMTKQTALTDMYAAYQKETFQPLEKEIVADAQAYDTPQRREQMAAQAMGNVGTQFDVARGTAARVAAATGVNPGSGNFASQMGVMGATEAAQKAGAGNAAIQNVETLGAAKKMDAASLGRNLASNQATSAGVALSQGNSAVANAQVPGAVASQGNALMTSGFTGAQAGLAGAANTYGAIANTQAKANEASSGIWGALGQVGGAAATQWIKTSDVNAKEDIEPVDPNEALEAVTATPVSSWAYKEGVSAADGGKKHVGPMAQDVKKTMGEKAAPGGKKIDLVSMNGITMAAIKALSSKVDRVLATQGLPA